jgi:hypothetical protein
VTRSKSSVVVALCILPRGKMNLRKKLLISKQNHKQKNAVKVVANVVYTAKLETKSLTKAEERATGADGGQCVSVSVE